MIDIHAHIIPGVDDGSPDMADSILMAELAVESGVDVIIATPHGNMSEGYDRQEQEKEHTGLIRERMRELRAEIQRRKMPLTILQGMEIFSTPDSADMLKEGILLPLNGTSHCLIEFDFEDSAQECTERIEEMLDIGFRPVIAHPERYTCIQHNISVAKQWISLGCQLQVNRGSIMGSFGRKPRRTVWEMLDQNMVTYIGSDAHSPYFRTTFMGDVYEVIADEFGNSTAEKLLKENAKEYLLGG